MCLQYQGFLSVRLSVTSNFYLGTYVLTRYVCSDTLSLTSDINHVLTRCHVTDINYVDRGAADPRRCSSDDSGR